MKRLLIDTDVLLDFLFDRQPEAQYTLELLLKCETKELIGYVTPVTLSNCYCVLRQNADHDYVQNQMKQLLSILKVLPVDKQTVQLALYSKFKDFEKAIHYFAARKSTKIDALVTRNLKDFKKSTIPVFSPGELLSVLQQEA